MQLSPLERSAYEVSRGARGSAPAAIRGEIRLSPLENADYTETPKTHVNPTSTPRHPRVILAFVTQ